MGARPGLLSVAEAKLEPHALAFFRPSAVVQISPAILPFKSNQTARRSQTTFV
jgi:hypothetical protein